MVHLLLSKRLTFVSATQLLLMKRGGRVIYGGKLGVQSQIMIDYFQVITTIITTTISLLLQPLVSCYSLVIIIFRKFLVSECMCAFLC